MSTAPRGTVAVAFSGGRDSTALLHATARAARALRLEVVALHVHHGLMPQADEWLARAQRYCARWRVAGLPLRFAAARLDGRPAKGDSVEAWARRERYAALTRLAHEQGARLVLLAHHRRDQAETVLLQMLRSAGPAGLAAMPRETRANGLLWCRPWLEQPREAIDAYLKAHRLRAVDDPSNADPRFARSRLRCEVWPALAAAFPEAESALAAVARHAQQANQLQEAIAGIDLAALRDGDRLRVTTWRQFDEARRTNALRAWLRERLGRVAPAQLVERLCRELPLATAARFPAGAGLELRLHRGRLSLGDAAQARDKPAAETVVDLSHPGTHAIDAWGGRFVVRPASRGGIPARALREARLCPRRGGEQFQSHARGVPRSLKKQYQAAAVPAWSRDGPLVWSGDALLFVPGLGADVRCLGRGPGLTLRWIPTSRLLRRSS